MIIRGRTTRNFENVGLDFLVHPHLFSVLRSNNMYYSLVRSSLVMCMFDVCMACLFASPATHIWKHVAPFCSVVSSKALSPCEILELIGTRLILIVFFTMAAWTHYTLQNIHFPTHNKRLGRHSGVPSLHAKRASPDLELNVSASTRPFRATDFLGV